ncbi:MAG: phage holin family protein [Dermatophilaceae bacterium]
MASPAAEPTIDRDSTDRDTTDQDTERTLGQLVASASKDVSTIVRGEIDLAKAEIRSAAQFAGKGAGMLAGAGLFALYALGLLLTALAWGLVAAGLATWLAFLIVAVLLFIIAGVLALLGRRALTRANLRPQQAIDSTQKTIAALKREG